MNKLFQFREAYKPFEHPVYYNEGWLPQMQAFWLHTKIPMQGDVKDWNENLEPHEKNLVGNILLGFAQTECAVSDYWTGSVTRWFPKHEIRQMAMCFGSQETIHAVAYSYLNETLGLDNFEAFLHEPAIAAKFDLLMETSNRWTDEDLRNAYNPDHYQGRLAAREVARSLAVFSAFAEGVSLFSSFAVLYSFQLRNLLKGVGQQMFWSVKDECLHSRMGCYLFKHMCHEFPWLKDAVEADIKKAATLIVELEERFIDKMFEQGDLVNLKSDDLKQFIRVRANEKLEELGYDRHLAENPEQASALDWFYDLTGGTNHTDFFASQPVITPRTTKVTIGKTFTKGMAACTLCSGSGWREFTWGNTRCDACGGSGEVADASPAATRAAEVGDIVRINDGGLVGTVTHVHGIHVQLGT